MEYTQNYHLPQWAEDDRILMPDFNAAMAAIEGGLTADKTEAAEGLAALTAQVGSGGHTCRMAYGSYTGTGTYGEGSPMTLNFPFRPLYVLIATEGFSPSLSLSHFLRPLQSSRSGENNNRLVVTWDSNAIHWNNLAGDMNPNGGNLNTSRYTYYYFAIGYDE